MPSSSRSFFSRARALLLLPVATVLASFGFEMSAFAVAPKAPTNVGIIATVYKVDANGNLYPKGTSTTSRVYKITWQDNSLDESGFRIEASFASTGPFEYIGAAAADSTEFVWGPYDPSQDATLYFRVSAFKYNGTKTEASASLPQSYGIGKTAIDLNAAESFKVTEINDGFLRFNWIDRSVGELYYQIFYKKNSEADSAYKPLSVVFFNTTQVEVQHNLVAGESYNFAIRAVRINTDVVQGVSSEFVSVLITPTSGNYPPANATFYKVPRLDPPTNLVVEKLDNVRAKLTWLDNSDNETSYEVGYRAPGSESSWSTISISKNLTSYIFAIGPGAHYEWRMRAVSSGSSLAIDEANDYSNVFTLEMPFINPQGLAATTSGISGAVELTWQDTSEDETNYDVFVREVDEETENDEWYLVESMQADSKRLTVKDRTVFEDYYSYLVDQSNETQTARVALTPDTEYEFKVVARYQDNSSDPTNVASAFARYGFTSRSYQPAQQDVAFSYTLAVADSANKLEWTVEDLPDGLTFDASVGTITGTPTESGVFICPMTVTYINYSATMPLTLRILKRPASPQAALQIGSATVGTGTQLTIPLEGKFTDADSEKAVRLEISGDRQVDLLLYPSLTPEAVNNFMGYVDNKAYDGVIFHRNVTDFVLQGGGYVPIQAPYYFASLVKRPSPNNEPGISNVRGSVAHAKVGGSPDSATHDFFFNLVDNNDASNSQALDNQNGGFTVFGRLAGNGIATVDAISDLPVGSYVTTTDAVGVAIDGAASSMTNVPMDVTDSTAPTTMDITKTVRITSAREVPIFKYEIVAGTAGEEAIAGVSILNGTDVLVEGGKAAGSRTVTLKAYDLDGNATQQVFTVNVIKSYKPPVISKQPVSVAVVEGKKAALVVKATGSVLEYQWQKKNGETWSNVSGADGATLSFTAVNGPDEEGEYRVVVSNEMTSVTSASARVDIREAPVITQPLTKQIVEVGEELKIESAATGAPVPALTWLRNGKTVSGQKSAALTITSAQLTDGGTYMLRANNVAGRVDSNTATVVVVDRNSYSTFVKNGATLTLKARVTGPVSPDVKYIWKRAGIVVQNSDRISGAGTATLVVKKFNSNLVTPDTGSYSCTWEKEDEGISEQTGAWRVYAAGAAPTYSSFVPDDAFVGMPYDYLLPGADPETNESIASFAVSGLPSGLTVNATSGRITGAPKSAGTYLLKVTVSNPAGSKTVPNIPLKVWPMPEAVVGVFVGQVENNDLNGNKGGRIDMTVTEGGTLSGKLTQAGKVYSFTGSMKQPTNLTAYYTSGSATIVRKGLTPLQIEFSAIYLSGYTDSGDVYGTISDGQNTADFVAYRNRYSSTGEKSTVVGRQHAALSVVDVAASDTSVPQGTGYMVITGEDSGVVKVTGRMADGTTFTSSSFVGGQNQFLVYQSLYKNTGSVLGLPKLTYYGSTYTSYLYRVSGELVWERDPQASASERLYKAGFGPVGVDVSGYTYDVEANKPYAMSLPETATTQGNASIDFEGAGLAQASLNPDLASIRISSSGTGAIPKNSGIPNPAATSVKMVSSTGLITGSFTLKDTAGTRKAAFYGLAIPRIPDVTTSDGTQVEGAAPTGVGHFLLPQLPSIDPVTTLKNSPILSGAVRLNPLPVVITQQPQSATVNSGANVTFTVDVAVNSGTQVYYQWRKGGVNISTAAGVNVKSYTLNSVTAADEDSYDVVITTVYSRVVSDAAELALNKPITSVTVTTEPDTAVLPVDGYVTFKATVGGGTGTLTYRWSKDGTEISGAAGAASTYTVGPLALTDSNSTYSVKVKNEATPDGVTGSKTITVANPITSVTIQRTPSTDRVGMGASVTFTIASIAGSTGPYTYQWKKDGENIEGATNSTYFISSANSDSVGNYSVMVKNGATPNGQESTPISLNVSTEVSNVNATRTPADQYLPLGDEVTFSVSAQGQPDFSYQWKKDGVDIDGATSADYYIDAIIEDDYGVYTVVVTNDENSVESNQVLLEKLDPVTSVSLNLEEGTTTIEAGGNIKLTAGPNVTTGDLTYRWYKDENELQDQADQPSIEINGVTGSDSGTYRVEVGNAANDGNLISSDPVTITVNEP